MTWGVRAEVHVQSPTGCPIAEVSAATDSTTTCISKADGHGEAGVTEEFILDTEGTAEAPDLEDSDFQQVFSYRSGEAYRFTRDPETQCLCNCIEAHDCPVIDVQARRGTIVVVFHAADMEQLQGVLTDLTDRWENVTVKRLLRSDGENDERDYVLLDRSELTDRQREVLEVALEMDFFEHGKGANAGEVAEALGVSTSTFSEHLRAAQRKLFYPIIGE